MECKVSKLIIEINQFTNWTHINQLIESSSNVKSVYFMFKNGFRFPNIRGGSERFNILRWEEVVRVPHYEFTRKSIAEVYIDKFPDKHNIQLLINSFDDKLKKLTLKGHTFLIDKLVIPHKLTYLDISSANFDLQDMDHLETLKLDNILITKTLLKRLTKVTDLTVSNCYLDADVFSEDFNFVSRAVNVTLEGNCAPVQFIIQNMENVEKLQLLDIKVTLKRKCLPNLQHLTLRNTSETTFRNLKTPNLSFCVIFGTIDYGYPANVKQICFADRSKFNCSYEFNLNNFESIKFFYLQYFRFDYVQEIIDYLLENKINNKTFVIHVFENHREVLFRVADKMYKTVEKTDNSLKLEMNINLKIEFVFHKKNVEIINEYNYILQDYY